jgi:hypothetical protein
MYGGFGKAEGAGDGARGVKFWFREVHLLALCRKSRAGARCAINRCFRGYGATPVLSNNVQRIRT